MSGLDFFLPAIILFLSVYHKSSIRPPPQAYLFQTHSRGAYLSGKAQVQEAEGHAVEDQKQIRTSSCE